MLPFFYMWIDKILYWKDDGNNTVYPPPTQKTIKYADIQYPNISMKIAYAVMDDDKETKLHQDEIAFHIRHNAVITYG